MSTTTHSQTSQFGHTPQDFRNEDVDSSVIAFRVNQIRSNWTHDEKTLRAELALERWVDLINIVERAAA